MYDVIIIGGGAAGLVAAKLLSEAGKKILLLEAKEQLGGRIQQAENLAFPAEIGAEFIHGNLHTTFELMKEAGIKSEKIKGNFTQVKNGKWNSDFTVFPYWELLMKKIHACSENISVDDFLDKNFKSKKYELLRIQFKRYVEGYDAADTKKASIQAIKTELEGDNEDQYRPVPGYQAIIGFLKKKCLDQHCDIKTGEAVKKITGTGPIEVITSQDIYLAKKVIIAVPLGVLQCKKGSDYYIDLPAYLKAYTKAAEKIGNGNVIKFLLEFDHAFWLQNDFLKANNISAPSYIFSDEVIPTWWTQYPTKLPLLTGWVAGPSTMKMKNFTEKKYKSLLLNSLSGIFSIPKKVLEKRLLHFEVKNWINEPFILGGYSYATLQTVEARKIMQQPYQKTFYFAGEYIMDNSSATVDAALQSGKAVAMKILND